MDAKCFVRETSRNLFLNGHGPTFLSVIVALKTVLQMNGDIEQIGSVSHELFSYSGPH